MEHIEGQVYKEWRGKEHDAQMSGFLNSQSQRGARLPSDIGRGAFGSV